MGITVQLIYDYKTQLYRLGIDLSFVLDGPPWDLLCSGADRAIRLACTANTMFLGWELVFSVTTNPKHVHWKLTL